MWFNPTGPVNWVTVVVIVVFAAAAVMLIGLVVLKAVHRRRAQGRRERHGQYVTLLSRHLASFAPLEPIDASAGDDDAFLDAVIDVRNVVAGREVDTLTGVVDKVGLARRQVVRLRSRFLLGRRLRAAVSLAEIGDDSTARVLLHHLADREPEIRLQCARGLGRMRHQPAIDVILERFGVEPPWVRARFADTLVGFGARATWPLVSYIRSNLRVDGNEGVVEAIRILGVIADRDAGLTLADLVRTAVDPEVQIAAIEALGAVGGPLAIRPLKQAFRSPDWRLRAKSATSLGQIGDPSVNRALSKGMEDANWWVRRNSASALASLHGGEDVLFEAISSEDPFARDAAAEALADCGALAAARDRAESGSPTERDLALLALIGGEKALA
jgi:HEAT repeat protein